jgi:hypothetical protein
METENPSVRPEGNWKVCTSAIGLYWLYLRDIVTEVTKSAITRFKTRYFCHAYLPTRDSILCSINVFFD